MMSTGEHEERAKGQPSGKGGEATPPPTDKVPEMPPEEWRNAGLENLERQFLSEGGFTEKLYRARSEARKTDV